MSLQDSHQISDVKVMLIKGIDGKGIASIEKTSSQGLVDVYTITYTDGTKSTFTVTNGAGGGMSSLFIITSEEGSTISVTSPTGRPLDVTPVSGSSTQWQCETVEYGSHTVTSDLGGATASATVNVDVCKIYNVSVAHFSASITATFPEGTTCQCRGTDETYFSSSSPHTFDVHSADTYTLTVTYDGTDYSTTVTITTDGQSESVAVPDPADAPVDDLDLWLMYGGVSGTYSTLSDVLADSSALATLMASSDAVDYLVRCTNWASTITADSSAMSYIGLNNYCSNTLLSDSTWAVAICDSTYFESVLNGKIPAMTSNSTPEGLVFASSSLVANQEWKAFDGDSSMNSGWVPTASQSNNYCGYKFIAPVKCLMAVLVSGSGGRNTYTYKAQASNDGQNTGYVDLASKSVTYTDGNQKTDKFIFADNAVPYEYVRMFCAQNNMHINGSYTTWWSSIQFYYRDDV